MMHQDYQDLLKQDDEYVFLNRGCHVFALALHERFRYPLVCLRELASNCVAHEYCRDAEYLVDVMGFNLEQDILEAKKWTPHDGYCAEEVTLSELEKRYVFAPPCHGLYGNALFLSQARRRADKRIETFKKYFDGKHKQSIKPHPFLNDTSRADSESVFS